MPGWMWGRRLVGRDRELGVLRGFVDAVATGGGSLLVVGEAGVGKTSLLDAAAAHAAELGTRVLRASGVEFEAEVSFAGLHQLVAPLAAELARVSSDARRAIGVAVGLAEGPAPDQLALTNSLLALLAEAADREPVLVVVDDLQWLDRASATLFGILARRLGSSRVGLLGVVRTGEGSVFEEAGLADIPIGPLDDDDAAVLLTDAFPEMPPRAARQVITEAQGNPLALIELPARLGSSAEPSLGRTSVGRRLRLTFARRIEGLPANTRAQLLLAALDGTGVLFPGVSAGELEPAERARLIRIHPVTRGIEFRHPLTRSAVVELSTESERRGAHRRLAGRHPEGSEQRAWHLAEAASAPDEQIAQLLEEAALRTKGRGDPVGAIGLLLRAAELSPKADDHQRRAMFAAYLGADVTGDLTDARVLVTEHIGQGHAVATVAAAAYLVNSGGDIDTAHRLLLGAVRNARRPVGVWDAPLTEMVYVLQANCSFGCRADLAEDYWAVLDGLGVGPPEILDLLGNTYLAPTRRAGPSLPLLDEAIAGIGDQADHAHAVRLGTAALYVDRIAGCRDALWRVVEHGRSGGAVAAAIKAYALLGFDGVLSGDWDGVLQLAEEGLAVTTRHHYRLLGGFLQYDQAMVAAARGDRTAVRRLADDLVSWAAPNRNGFVLQLAAHAKAVDAMSHGEFETAYRHAAEICSQETLPAHKPAALWVLLDLVEAAVRAGLKKEASAHVADIHRSGVADFSSRLAMIAAGATGMTAPAASFRAAFDTALATPGADRWPFTQARIQLAYAERLRRAQCASQARHHLTDALGTFERLGAAPWAARARAELRASGTPAAHSAPGTTAQLTPQEREIATLAAAGLTNKQIGERLYLSPRTVSTHLYHLFPKLGISSRAALRDALADLRAPEQ
ncbi:helix-turn-helix transcriptional regulator [Streptomyces chiangmaiensis]|uniref:AAA family ATPase n=1 Tax=Streptomyces chiangmaiensis TaxID=766497 RepID=A0ABU7FLY0_9ACTN|nr:AAA family ATPase [Streptomyces chiangmaiensis]MED7824944.1 AAA family ATPase [Streptomyces chiangmaiensis]